MSHSFNSNALGFGGVITAPKRALIPSVASAVLAPTGGFGSATVTDYHYGDLISIGEARSEVFGTPTLDGGFFARARVLLTNVDVTDVLHADFLEATVTSTKGGRPEDVPLIELDATYHGLTIFGLPVAPVLDLGFFNTRPEYQQLADTTATADLAATSLVKKQKTDSEMLRGTIVKAGNDIPAARRAGAEFTIPTFGTVYLGEVLVKKARRRLNMLRISLDSKTPFEVDTREAAVESKGGGGFDGFATFGSADSNGSEIYP
ncbi:MAG TPA: hypothetical protein VN181_03975 [Thermoanaerobaculia bacterium]|nr:hypothetical protein [Thermoanaerobaculia bacterium]